MAKKKRTRTVTQKARDAYDRLKTQGHFKKAGYMGGITTALRGPDYYREIGKKGNKTMQQYTEEDEDAVQEKRQQGSGNGPTGRAGNDKAIKG